MKLEDVKKQAFAMPLTNPAFPSGPYRVVNREFLIITYRTEMDALRAVVPEPLEVTEPLVKYEFIRMPDSTGFGDYAESGQVIPVSLNGVNGGYVHAMYLNDEAPIAGGREIWGFPKTVEEIDFRYADDSATCKLTMGGQHVLTLSVPRGGEGSTPDSAAVGYTLIEGIPHQNEFVRGGEGEQTIPGGEGVVLELGDHPIAGELRSLGLETATPMLSAWSEHMRGSFGQSVKL